MKLPKKSPDYEENIKNKKTCLLLYSGGVDTSVCVYLLQKYYGYRVITFTVDVCQDTAWAAAMAKKAKKLGAIKTIVYDGRDEYAKKYLTQIIKANALYDDYYPIGTSIARPWQAKIAMDIAKKLNVHAIAHGNKGKGAGAFQFNMVLNFFMPKKVKLVAPIGDWWPSREDEVAFAINNKIPIPVSQKNPFSYDDNIMSNAINYGAIDVIDKSVPEEAFKWTVPIERTPDKPSVIEIEFKNGIPVYLNKQKMKLATLFQKLNTLGGKHGIGRVDMIENGLYGNKFKWVYENPAAQMIIYSHKELEKLILPKETLWFKHDVIDKKWTQLIYQSLVYSPLAQSLMTCIENMQKYVNGTIWLKLYKGSFVVIKRQTKDSLVGIDSHNFKLRQELDTVPFGFEEYLFSSKHPEVFTNHLGVAQEKNYE